MYYLMMVRAGLVVVVLLVTGVGCGSDTKLASTEGTTAAVLAPTSTVGASYDPLKASASERYKRFSDLVVTYGGSISMEEREALSVAGNFCDQCQARKFRK